MEKRGAKSIRRLCLLVLLTCAATGGCNPRSDLGQVRGTVRLDGRPLVDAFLLFIPIEGPGSTAYGRTDQNGEYELMYSRSVVGAAIGKCNVRMTTREVKTGVDGKDAYLPERVPKKYREDSAISVTVNPGNNVIDFELASDEGKAPSPQSGE